MAKVYGDAVTLFKQFDILMEMEICMFLATKSFAFHQTQGRQIGYRI